jgi:hypothetical protein
MSETVTCPYCNGLLPAAGGACPRCGEGAGPAATSAPPGASGPRRRGPAIVVGAVLLMAAGSAAIFGRHHLRTAFAPATAPAKPVVLKPWDMPGLGHLPESTEAVLAIQMPFLLERLGPAAQDDPSQALTALGLPPTVAEIVDKASGVGLKNVDHLVIGLTLEGHALPPQLVIVIHARQPFDLGSIAGKAKAHEQRKDGRTLYTVKAPPLPEVDWWQAADRVLVATISPADFKGVPGAPRTGIGHLRPELATVIRDQLADDACAWFAASSDKWNQYVSPYVLLQIPPFAGRNDLLKPAERLRSVAVSIPHDPHQRVDVQIGEKSAEAGAELRGLLTVRFRGEEAEVSGEAETCRLQLENDPQRIASLFNRLIGGK